MNVLQYFAGRAAKHQKIAIIGLIALIILCNAGFKYINWNPTLGGWLQKTVLFALLIFYFCNKIDKRTCYFRKYVYLLILLPFLSSINAYLYFAQGFYDSFIALSSCFIWLLYFILHKYKVSEASVLKTFLLIALFVVAVQIIQQFTYPNALFGVSNPDDLSQNLTEIAEKRNGLWRFRMHQNGYYTVPILFAIWGWFRQRYNLKLLPFISLLLISVYMTLTRQVIASCILALFFSFFLGHKMKISSMLLVFFLAIGLYFSYDVLFSNLAEQTKEDATEDNIRILAANYFGNESLKTPLTFLFGYGQPNSPQFNVFIQQLRETLHFFTEDVGIIGQIYASGSLYTMVFYVLMFRIFFKLKHEIPDYIRLFIIYTVIMSPMIFPLMGGMVTFVIWSMILYICDLHISHSQLALKSTQNERNKF